MITNHVVSYFMAIKTFKACLEVFGAEGFLAGGMEVEGEIV